MNDCVLLLFDVLLLIGCCVFVCLCVVCELIVCYIVCVMFVNDVCGDEFDLLKLCDVLIVGIVFL